MTVDCIFCKIGRREIEGDIVDHDDHVFVVRDISPQAPVHLLVVPYEHLGSLTEINEGNAGLMERMVLMANRAARLEGVAESGYRLAVNCGKEGAQSVGHLHMHVLGGRQLSGQLG